jgi:hypothetical protein
VKQRPAVKQRWARAAMWFLATQSLPDLYRFRVFFVLPIVALSCFHEIVNKGRIETYGLAHGPAFGMITSTSVAGNPKHLPRTWERAELS